MNKPLPIYLQKLPMLKDPTYWGIFVVRHLLLIIASVFVFLALAIFMATSLSKLDITIKANVDGIEKCAAKNDRYCALLNITPEQEQHIKLNNVVRIEVTADGSYRHSTINGSVRSIEHIVRNDRDLLQIVVELEPTKILTTKLTPTSGFIVVGSQTSWDLIISTIREKL